jgi:hypothetical protein
MNESFSFISIDPPDAVAIFNQDGKLLLTGKIPQYTIAEEFKGFLEKIKQQHFIQFAVIEKYVQYSRIPRPNAWKVQTSVQLCTEVFPQHILVQHVQWNPRKYKKQYKKEWAYQEFERMIETEHELDAALMGRKIFSSAQFQTGSGFLALQLLARTAMSWPTQKQESLARIWEKAG